VTNEMVNRAGITFVHEARGRTAATAAEIARAYLITREVFALPGMWEAIEALDNQVPATLQVTMLLECGRMLDRGTVWFLRESGRPLDVVGQVTAYGTTVAGLAGSLPALLCPEDRDRLAREARAFVAEGVPESLAHRIASLPWMVPLCDIVRVARQTGVPAEQVGRIYFDLGSRLGFDWLRQAAKQVPTDNAWSKQAVSAIVDELLGQQRELTVGVLSNGQKDTPAERAVAAWSEGRREFMSQTDQLLAELRAIGTPDLAMLAVANRHLKSARD
jgi:glutamate dehydrogenase